MILSPEDRLTASRRLLEETYAQQSQLEHALIQERKRADEAEAKRLRHERALRDLIADESETADVVWAVEAVLRGEPKPS